VNDLSNVNDFRKVNDSENPGEKRNARLAEATGLHERVGDGVRE
jgi:hypothetical protein